MDGCVVPCMTQWRVIDRPEENMLNYVRVRIITIEAGILPRAAESLAVHSNQLFPTSDKH